MTIEVYQRGETVPIWCENRTWADVLFNPEEGVKITLYKPDGTLADVSDVDIEDTAMHESSTGKYVYYYHSASDDPVGWWHYSCKAVDGTDPNTKVVITHGSFKLN